MSEDESSDSSTIPEEINQDRIDAFLLKRMQKLEKENATLIDLLNKGKSSDETQTAVSPTIDQDENARQDPLMKPTANNNSENSVDDPNSKAFPSTSGSNTHLPSRIQAIEDKISDEVIS